VGCRRGVERGNAHGGRRRLALTWSWGGEDAPGSDMA
jgi:hypothetical protein